MNTTTPQHKLLALADEIREGRHNGDDSHLFCVEQDIRALAATLPPAHSVDANKMVATDNGQGLRDAITAALSESLGNAMDCMRVWDAWRVGTMSEDDFSIVRDDGDRLTEIVDAVFSALATHPPQQERATRIGADCNINPAFWIDALRTNVHTTDCDAKKQVLRNCADNLERYIAALETKHGTAVNAVVQLVTGKAAPAAPATPESAEPVAWPLYLGREYRTQGGETVRFVTIHNAGTPYESMEDENGVHRYTRRPGDLGRVTGSAHDYSHPGNIVRPTPAASDGGLREALYTDEEVAEAMEVIRGRHGSTALITEALDEMERVLLANASNEPPTEQAKPSEPFRFVNTGDSEAQFVADAERLNCPACGGSGHVDDVVAAPAQVTDAEVEVMRDAYLSCPGGINPMRAAGNALLALRAAQPDAGGVVVDACRHEDVGVRYDHHECMQCGAVRTDSGPNWILQRTWFPTLAAAKAGMHQLAGQQKGGGR